MRIIDRIVRYQNKLDGIIVNHLNPVQEASFRAIRRKMVFAKAFCGIDYMLFFRYHCEHLSFRQITQIVLFDEQDSLWSQVNSAESRTILNNKYKTYLQFKDYYQRDMVFVSDKEAEDEFASFCHAHSRFIVKPLTEACGRGI